MKTLFSKQVTKDTERETDSSVLSVSSVALKAFSGERRGR
jgi:hypothetical protein